MNKEMQDFINSQRGEKLTPEEVLRQKDIKEYRERQKSNVAYVMRQIDRDKED